MEGYYINLDKRIDRKKEIEKYIKKYYIFNKLKRFSAVEHNYGALGCALSHIKCLKHLMKTKGENFIILEDDFFILKKSVFIDFCKDFERIKDNNSWNMVLLTPLGLVKEENVLNNFHRMICSQTTSGYIIKKSYVPKLLGSFIESVKVLENIIDLKDKSKQEDLYAIDQYWKKLQKKDIFLRYKNIFAGQKPGFSDIGQNYYNFNHKFLNQVGYLENY